MNVGGESAAPSFICCMYILHFNMELVIFKASDIIPATLHKVETNTFYTTFSTNFAFSNVA